MAGICSSSVKRSPSHHVALAFLKIEPDHFPEGKKLGCLASGPGSRSRDVDMSRCSWVQTVEWRAWVNSLICPAQRYPTQEPITTVCPCYCKRRFLVFVFLIGSLFFVQGGVSKQVLLRPGLQIPPLHLRKHPGREVWGMRSDRFSSSLNVTCISWWSVWCWIVIFACDAVSHVSPHLQEGTLLKIICPTAICYKLLITF